MAPNWQRLIRFKTPSGSVVYGDPSAFMSGDDLPASGAKAHVVEGGVQEGKVTSRVEEVAELLAPVPMEEVPIVACWLNEDRIASDDDS